MKSQSTFYLRSVRETLQTDFYFHPIKWRHKKTGLPACGGGGGLQVSQTSSCCSISVPSSASLLGWRLIAGEAAKLLL